MFPFVNKKRDVTTLAKKKTTVIFKNPYTGQMGIGGSVVRDVVRSGSGRESNNADTSTITKYKGQGGVELSDPNKPYDPVSNRPATDLKTTTSSQQPQQQNISTGKSQQEPNFSLISGKNIYVPPPSRLSVSQTKVIGKEGRFTRYSMEQQLRPSYNPTIKEVVKAGGSVRGEIGFGGVRVKEVNVPEGARGFTKEKTLSEISMDELRKETPFATRTEIKTGKREEIYGGVPVSQLFPSGKVKVETETIRYRDTGIGGMSLLGGGEMSMAPPQQKKEYRNDWIGLLNIQIPEKVKEEKGEKYKIPSGIFDQEIQIANIRTGVTPKELYGKAKPYVELGKIGLKEEGKQILTKGIQTKQYISGLDILGQEIQIANIKTGVTPKELYGKAKPYIELGKPIIREEASKLYQEIKPAFSFSAATEKAAVSMRDILSEVEKIRVKGKKLEEQKGIKRYDSISLAKDYASEKVRTYKEIALSTKKNVYAEKVSLGLTEYLPTTLPEIGYYGTKAVAKGAELYTTNKAVFGFVYGRFPKFSKYVLDPAILGTSGYEAVKGEGLERVVGAAVFLGTSSAIIKSKIMSPERLRTQFIGKRGTSIQKSKLTTKEGKPFLEIISKDTGKIKTYYEYKVPTIKINKGFFKNPLEFREPYFKQWANLPPTKRPLIKYKYPTSKYALDVYGNTVPSIYFKRKPNIIKPEFKQWAAPLPEKFGSVVTPKIYRPKLFIKGIKTFKLFPKEYPYFKSQVIYRGTPDKLFGEIKGEFITPEKKKVSIKGVSELLGKEGESGSELFKLSSIKEKSGVIKKVKGIRSFEVKLKSIEPEYEILSQKYDRGLFKEELRREPKYYAIKSITKTGEVKSEPLLSKYKTKYKPKDFLKEEKVIGSFTQRAKYQLRKEGTYVISSDVGISQEKLFSPIYEKQKSFTLEGKRIKNKDIYSLVKDSSVQLGKKIGDTYSKNVLGKYKQIPKLDKEISVLIPPEKQLFYPKRKSEIRNIKYDYPPKEEAIFNKIDFKQTEFSKFMGTRQGIEFYGKFRQGSYPIERKDLLLKLENLEPPTRIINRDFLVPSTKSFITSGLKTDIPSFNFRFSPILSRQQPLQQKPIIKLSPQIKNEIIPKIKLREDIISSLKPALREELKPALKEELKPQLREELRTTLREELKPQLREELRENLREELIPKIPITPKIPPPERIPFEIDYPLFRRPKQKLKKIKLYRPTKYLPSLVALEFKIKGTEPKLLSGFGIRPIPLFKYKTKKKIKKDMSYGFNYNLNMRTIKI